MANKELVIKIDENEYNNLIKRAHENIHALSHVDKMILHGVPLPEEHGNLVDIKEVEEYLNNIQLELDGWGDTVTGVEIAKARIGLDSIPTIIEEVKERG